MENTDNWKQKYFESLEKLEKLEHKTKSWEELENLLRLGMNRVAVAAQGLDPVLDKHLESLRNAVRSGNYPDLEEIIEKISTTVIRLDEQRRHHQSNTVPQLLEDLLSQLRFPNSHKKRLKALRKTLSALDEKGPFDEALHQLAELVNESADLSHAPEGDSSATGLFSRWFGQGATKASVSAESQSSGGHRRKEQDTDLITTLGQQLRRLLQILPAGKTRDDLTDRLRASADLVELTQCLTTLVDDLSSGTHAVDFGETSVSQWSSSQEALSAEQIVAGAAQSLRYRGISWGDNEQQIVATFCLRLMEALHFPEELHEHVQALRETITEGFDMVETGSIIQKIADLITATRVGVEKEKQELQNFLLHLTEHLKDIDNQLSGVENHRRANIENNKTLTDAVQEQVNIIETSVNDASELHQLKSDIQQRLLTIRNHFEQHRQLEEQQQQQLEQALAESNARLQTLELESKQLRQRLTQEHQQAIHDTLTGVHNRLAYEERIEQEFARWKRYQQPLVIMIFDIDYFKRINDTYGHKAGDKALKLIAKTLQKNLRESDFIARYGGEEFVVLMPQTELEAAMGAANKLREAVLECQFHYQQKQVNISISCGATQFKHDDTIDKAFQRADQALYNAKQKGRNYCEALE